MKGVNVIYCGSKSSNTGHCAEIASYKVKLTKRSVEGISASLVTSYRCECHKQTGTNGMKIVEREKINQVDKINIINDWLKSLIGKKIQATTHTAKELEVKYVKEDRCAVMCFQPITKKWKFVYYNQIKE